MNKESKPEDVVNMEPVGCRIARILTHYKQWMERTGSWVQMNRLSLRNNRLKFKTAGELPIILEEFIEEYMPI
jgi:hypothetical protein